MTAMKLPFIIFLLYILLYIYFIIKLNQFLFLSVNLGVLIWPAVASKARDLLKNKPVLCLFVCPFLMLCADTYTLYVGALGPCVCSQDWEIHHFPWEIVSMADCSHCGLAPGAEPRLSTTHFWKSCHPSSTKLCFSSPYDIEDNWVNVIDFSSDVLQA